MDTVAAGPPPLACLFGRLGKVDGGEGGGGGGGRRGVESTTPPQRRECATDGTRLVRRRVGAPPRTQTPRGPTGSGSSQGAPLYSTDTLLRHAVPAFAFFFPSTLCCPSERRPSWSSSKATTPKGNSTDDPPRWTINPRPTARHSPAAPHVPSRGAVNRRRGSQPRPHAVQLAARQHTAGAPCPMTISVGQFQPICLQAQLCIAVSCGCPRFRAGGGP